MAAQPQKCLETELQQKLVLAQKPTSTQASYSSSGSSLPSSKATVAQLSTPTPAADVYQLLLLQVPSPTSTNPLDQVNRYSNEGKRTIRFLKSPRFPVDVQPTDWAFQALQSLVERYGVIAGYPDGTYRNRNDTLRVAAGLNAALDRVNDNCRRYY